MQNTVQLSDEQLVEYIAKEDQELFSEIVLRYQKKLFRYANSLSKDSDKAADIVQNSFIKAFINLKSFKTEMKFSTWIYRIVHNEAINEIKKNKQHVEMPEGFDIRSEGGTEPDFDRQEMIQKVRSCLDKIPILYREPLSLYFLEEKSYNEIADILRLPLGTVGTRINRAKIFMKKICQIKK
ncbi:MAG TPA: RNA polymerase sigma factor [bacterium]|nr:RNA polymerase sigma factor [bacterium]